MESNDSTVKYHSKIVGVTFEGRQDIIKVLKGDEPLQVRREKDNQYDPNAVAVDVKFGEEFVPVGYIAKDKNADIAAALDAGESVYISQGGITGGDIDKDGKQKSFGMNIKLEYKKAGAADSGIAEVPAQTDPLQLLAALLSKDLEITVTAKKKNVTTYTSRLLGKATEVHTAHGGHVSLPGYLSGSSFPKQFYQEFDSDGILQGIVDKFNVSKEAVQAMWGLNRDASTGYGTAIHAALENYDTYYRLGDKIKKVETFKTKPDKVGPNKALSRNPFLKKIVEDFHEKFGGDYVRLTEQFVWLHDKKLCGSIDRVKVIDAEKKIVRIQDYKTDGDIHEKTYQLTTSPFYELTQGIAPIMGKELLDLHWLQLSFYAYILAQYGYTVEGLDVYWLNPNTLITGENAWESFSHGVIDISKAL